MKNPPALQRVLLTAAALACGAFACGPGARGADAVRSTSIVFDPATVRLVGRFHGARYAWSGATIEVRFRGPSLAIGLVVPAPPPTEGHGVDGKATVSREATLPYAVFVDGRRAADLQAGPHARRYVVASGLEPTREHVVRVVREAEARAGVHEVVGVELPGGGELLPPRPRAFGIEVVGDSIACGYGVLGADERCGFSYATERATLAWPFLLGEALEADVTLMCWSGRGVHRNYDGSTRGTMPDLVEPPARDEELRWMRGTSRPPSLVISALGTNDFLSPAAAPADVQSGALVGPFQRRYAGLLGTLRGWFDAPIVVAGSPMLGPEPVRRLGDQTAEELLRGVVALRSPRDPNVHFVPLPFQGKRLGCDYHPNADMQRIVAAAMEAALREANLL